ncbi:MAG TPA: carbohydrate-binding family 9-like protein [Verrucomicrobiae bacterium]|nr:carbohydrate-binding family 9-like protein [Verrucomicrobiae bacterium]
MQKPRHEIICPRLTNFKFDDFDSVSGMFEGIPAIAMQQAWLPALEADFAPASVRTGWRDEALFVFAELTDADIFTRATRHNERLWELGDVFEIFLRPDAQQAYTEFHIAPNNLRLQLRFADTEALKRLAAAKSLENAMIDAQLFESAVWVRPEEQRWHVSAKIPAASICEAKAPMQGSLWHFSFSRYDYTRGREKPVISSTSPHAIARFHSQAEWGTLRFSP